MIYSQHLMFVFTINVVQSLVSLVVEYVRLQPLHLDSHPVKLRIQVDAVRILKLVNKLYIRLTVDVKIK